MNNEELLNSVIKKYELADPLPAEVRAFMEKSRREGLVNILRQDAPRAIMVTAAVSFFLWIKKFGVTVSIVKSAVAVTAAAAIGAGAVTAAGVYGTVKVTRYLSSDNSGVKTIEVTGTETSALQDNTDLTLPRVLYYDLAVSPVEMDSDVPGVLQEYTHVVIDELRKVNGEHSAISIDLLDSNHKSDRVLGLSIIKLDDNPASEYRVSAKIINSRNSQVIKHISRTVRSESEIPGSLRSLAVKVSAGL